MTLKHSESHLNLDEQQFLAAPTKRGRIPKWLEQRVKNFTGKRHSWEALQDFQNVLPTRGWLDHWGKKIYRGQEYLVSQPYSPSEDSMTRLFDFCKKLNLECAISAAASTYLPGDTVLIIISPQDTLPTWMSWQKVRPAREMISS